MPATRYTEMENTVVPACWSWEVLWVLKQREGVQGRGGRLGSKIYWSLDRMYLAMIGLRMYLAM